jgi:hypothetical protein
MSDLYAAGDEFVRRACFAKKAVRAVFDASLGVFVAAAALRRTVG